MNNFTFHNPTRLLFGKGMIEKLSTAIPMVHRIMITFGGGSVKQNGVYDQVIKALKDRDYIEFWGIEPNPTIETLREAIQIAKGKQVDFLLAVGGGSVIDGTKLISAGIQYDGDPWELVQKGYYYHTVPMGTVLPLPATGPTLHAPVQRSSNSSHAAPAAEPPRPQVQRILRDLPCRRPHRRDGPRHAEVPALVSHMVLLCGIHILRHRLAV